MFSDYSGLYWTVSALGLAGKHHIAVTKLGTSHTVFFDGVPMAPQTSDKTVNWSYALQIGIQKTTSQLYPFLGQISDPFIHNRALSPAEIQQLADPSNVMLSGLILSPKRRIFSVAGGAANRRRRLLICGAA